MKDTQSTIKESYLTYYRKDSTIGPNYQFDMATN